MKSTDGPTTADDFTPREYPKGQLEGVALFYKTLKQYPHASASMLIMSSLRLMYHNRLGFSYACMYYVLRSTRQPSGWG